MSAVSELKSTCFKYISFLGDARRTLFQLEHKDEFVFEVNSFPEYKKTWEPQTERLLTYHLHSPIQTTVSVLTQTLNGKGQGRKWEPLTTPANLHLAHFSVSRDWGSFKKSSRGTDRFVNQTKIELTKGKIACFIVDYISFMLYFFKGTCVLIFEMFMLHLLSQTDFIYLDLSSLPKVSPGLVWTCCSPMERDWYS